MVLDCTISINKPIFYPIVKLIYKVFVSMWDIMLPIFRHSDESFNFLILFFIAGFGRV